MRRAGLYEQIDPAVWHKKWVVHSISDYRVLSCDDGRVSFSYRKSGSTRTRTMTLDASECIRRFLEHVLPSGFQKVRHYGFASPNATLSFEAVRWLITLHAGRNVQLSALRTPPDKATNPIHCPECGSTLLMLGFGPAKRSPSTPVDPCAHRSATDPACCGLRDHEARYPRRARQPYPRARSSPPG